MTLYLNIFVYTGLYIIISKSDTILRTYNTYLLLKVLNNVCKMLKLKLSILNPKHVAKKHKVEL